MPQSVMSVVFVFVFFLNAVLMHPGINGWEMLIPVHFFFKICLAHGSGLFLHQLIIRRGRVQTSSSNAKSECAFKRQTSSKINLLCVAG